MKAKVKSDTIFALFVMSAARKLDSKKVKTLLGVKSLSFATEEEVRQVRRDSKGYGSPKLAPSR